MESEIKKSRKPSIALGVFAASFIVSAVCWFFCDFKNRNVFYFKSFDSKNLYTETEYTVKPQDKVRTFVDDLILGPMTNRYVRIFPQGTRAEFCHSKDGNLYIGLSKEALKVSSESLGIREGCLLLRENIVRNFTNFNKIYIYIDGESVFQE